MIENPFGTYAFASAYFVPGSIVETTTRQTYSILDWLGDIGGLHDILVLIVQLFLNSYQGFFQASLLLTNLFRFLPGLGKTEDSQNPDPPKPEMYDAVKEAIKGDTKRIKSMNFLFYCFCFRSRARLSFRTKLDKATAQIERELDLGRFLRR